MTHERFLWIYLLVVASAGPVLLWLTRKRLRAVEERRKKRIDRIGGGYDAVQTSSAFEKPVKMAHESALEGIETRFSIFRRVIKYALLLVWIIALIFPFLHRCRPP